MRSLATLRLDSGAGVRFFDLPGRRLTRRWWLRLSRRHAKRALRDPLILTLEQRLGVWHLLDIALRPVLARGYDPIDAVKVHDALANLYHDELPGGAWPFLLNPRRRIIGRYQD